MTEAKTGKAKRKRSDGYLKKIATFCWEDLEKL